MGKLIALIVLLTAGCSVPQHRHFLVEYPRVFMVTPTEMWVEAIEAGNGTVLYKVFETTGAL